ncbi:hypothetical protein D3C73_1254720 [compost metagenome]
MIRHQHTVHLYSRLIGIGIGRHAALHLEKVIRIAVHIRLRGCGQPYHIAVKILKYGAEFLKDTPVRFIHDNQVKVGGCEEPLTVITLGPVNGIQHRRIGGEHNTGRLVILITEQIAERHIWQIVLEIVLRLFDQSLSVGQKQDIGHISPSG